MMVNLCSCANLLIKGILGKKITSHQTSLEWETACLQKQGNLNYLYRQILDIGKLSQSGSSSWPNETFLEKSHQSRINLWHSNDYFFSHQQKVQDREELQLQSHPLVCSLYLYQREVLYVLFGSEYILRSNVLYYQRKISSINPLVPIYFWFHLLHSEVVVLYYVSILLTTAHSYSSTLLQLLLFLITNIFLLCIPVFFLHFNITFKVAVLFILIVRIKVIISKILLMQSSSIFII